MQSDYAILSKPIIPSSSSSSNYKSIQNWNLVFTRSGKYFFYNDKSGERCWIPPIEIIESMKQFLGPTKMEIFFDPFSIEDVDDVEDDNEDDNEDDSEDDSKDDKEEADGATAHDTKIYVTRDNIVEDEDNFKLYLLRNSVDPFAPWPSILSSHSSSPEFLAIPSDRRRQELFSHLCPLLIEHKREMTRKRLEEAKEWWTRVKEENWRMGASWFQVIRKVKGNQKFALLNEKECEKDYKNKK